MYSLFFRNILYPVYESLICQRSTLKYLKEYELNQHKSQDELLEIQWIKLKALLEHAYTNVPYYRDLWREEGISLDSFRSAEDLSVIPILTKSEIKTNYNSLVAGNYRGKTISKKTGGSTGSPLTFEITRESYERRSATMWRGYGWSGFRMGANVVYFWGGDQTSGSWIQRKKVSLYHALFNRSMIDTFNMSENILSEYVDTINLIRPKVVVGYVKPLVILSNYVNQSSKRLWKPKTILTGAEPLLEYERLEIEKAFGSSVSNTYGCREFGLIAAECNKKHGLHINIDHLLVEIVDTDKKTPTSSEGDIIITDLHNYGMPLIRYANGDMGIKSDKKCACGLELPLLGSISGRRLDAIVSLEGHILPGEFFPHKFKDIEGLLKFQVVQEKINEINIKLVIEDQFDASKLDLVKNDLAEKLGKGMLINYEFVDDIPQTSGGKHRVTISKLDS